MNDKIKQLLIRKQLTPSHFADEIGVQRSSISHILAGRNRPSLDIIQKIVRRFPDVRYEWLLDETGLPENAPDQLMLPEQPAPITGRTERSTTGSRPGAATERASLPPVRDVAPGQPVGSTGAAEKKVERMIVFYSDGTFREYKPAELP